jgi:hypothetical protein
MKTTMQNMTPGKTEGSYTRRWLLKSSATFTAVAAAVASLGPGVAGAGTISTNQSRKSSSAHTSHQDFEVGGI